MSVDLRPATAADIAAIVGLYADDEIGHGREGAPTDPRYLNAFHRMESSPDNTLFVMAEGGAIIGVAQLTVIPGLSRRGATRAIIEGVRIASARRGEGLGRKLIGHLIGEASRSGCRLVQLTSDKSRTEAHRFYESMGFVRSHDGFKLDLP